MPTITFTLPVSGTVITAGLHSANYSALQTLLNGGLDNANITAGAAIDLSKLAAAAWTTYTPVWTSGGTPPAIGNGTLSGRYIQIGKSVLFLAQMTAGTTTTFGSANAWTVSLPVTAAASSPQLGWVRANDSGTTYIGVAHPATSTTVVPIYQSSLAGAVTNFTNTTPFTWGSGDFFQAQGFYEAA